MFVWWRAVAVAAVVIVVSAGVASADIGAGVGADPITLPQPALPGREYSMPPVLVVNTGTEPSRYAVLVQRIRSGEQESIPKEWVQFGKNDFTLGPKESTTVPVKVSIPKDAKPGEYYTNIVVGTLAEGPAGGTALGARAATDLKLKVGEPRPAIPWPWPWWSYAALASAVALSGGMALSRRLGVSIQVERRT